MTFPHKTVDSSSKNKALAVVTAYLLPQTELGECPFLQSARQPTGFSFRRWGPVPLKIG
jgi:hypothetical protein